MMEASSSNSKKRKVSEVYSQPKDTGTGTAAGTQLHYAVDTLKNNNGQPMRLQDLAIMHNLEDDPQLLKAFKEHSRVAYDPRTGLYSYKHDFMVNSKVTLLTEIQKHSRKGGGVSVRTLKEAWKDAPTQIEALEAEGEVLVTRTAKDGTMKMVFFNEHKLDSPSVEDEFKKMWNDLVVPPEVELMRLLDAEGLQATQSEMVIPKAQAGKKKGSRKGAQQRARPTRIMNTHLKDEGIDLSHDFNASKP
ncbi:transcription initiation factor IIE, beta subunit [Auriculariales sp. MPI-PUGE-AT-0066]|nr:transcription initiation factor IIE, beta subunit [Auriculariales sp. MPI-PUGE-AT-0066]